jgi:hypothetical protein
VHILAAPWRRAAGNQDRRALVAGRRVRARTKIAAEQEARFEADVWEPLIANYLDRDLVTPKRTTILDIAEDALNFEPHRLGE